LQKLFDAYPNQIAGVMLEPATTLLPCVENCNRTLSYDSTCRNCPELKQNFLQQVQTLCRKNHALFILDEMITGFRWHLKGAQHYFGVEPDLSTFGKGMANGYSVAALVGRREIMDVGSISIPGNERTFLLSTTHGGEMSGLRAFIETVKVYKERDVCQHFWTYGEKLRNGLADIAREFKISDHFFLEGASASMSYITRDSSGDISMDFKTLFAQEMVRNGVLMSWIAVSLSHGELELQMTLEAARKSLRVYEAALNNGIEKYLEGPSIKPVFRKYN
jgi:glutamate-1-semialdehyde 2,1-aminomutase